MAIAWPTNGGAIAGVLKWGNDRESELEDYAAVAVSKIEQKVGPWHGQELTHQVVVLHRTRRLLALPWPIGQLVSVTRDGSPVTEDVTDLDAGVIYGEFPPGVYIVTASARSSATCPPDVALAAAKLGAHLAKQSLVGPRQPGFTGGPDKDIDVQHGFALPRAVSELIADYVRPGGFA